MEGASQLKVFGVLGGYSGEMVGGGARVENAGVAVRVRVVRVAVVLWTDRDNNNCLFPFK